MERSEVLIVEARQDEKGGLRLVVPWLFGYTEQARRIEKAVTLTSGERRKWTENDFFVDAEARLDEVGVRAVRRLLDFARSKGLEIGWGDGPHRRVFHCGSHEPRIESRVHRLLGRQARACLRWNDG